MRLTDIALAIPPLVMALAVAAVLSPDLINSMLAIAALWWTWHTRLIYSITRQLRGQEFVEAAETLGASKFHILFREILPNCVSAIAVKTSLDCGFVILVGASLSFLGLGIQPPTPDLGTMVAVGLGLPARLLVGIGAAGLRHPVRRARLQPARRRPARPLRRAGGQMSAGPAQRPRPLGRVHHLRPHRARAEGRVARRARAFACRAGRRERLGQDRHHEGDHGPAPASARHDHRRPHPL